jgi:hypothetical protein
MMAEAERQIMNSQDNGFLVARTQGLSVVVHRHRHRWTSTSPDNIKGSIVCPRIGQRKDIVQKMIVCVAFLCFILVPSLFVNYKITTVKNMDITTTSVLNATIPQLFLDDQDPDDGMSVIDDNTEVFNIWSVNQEHSSTIQLTESDSDGGTRSDAGLDVIAERLISRIMIRLKNNMAIEGNM